MNIAPKRPALRYSGSKWQQAEHIYSHFPAHEHRVIPFAGSLSDTLRWPIPKLETVNDLDKRVVNFFAVLRERPSDLVRQIQLTPWHEDEYKLSRITDDDPLEDARRFWCTGWMSVQGGPNPGTSGFRFMKSREKRYTITPGDGINIDHLYIVAERLKFIQFLSQDAVEFIGRFTGEPNVLLYVDPPYLKDTRSGATFYNHDSTIELHERTAVALRQCAGYVVVCGYAHPLYIDLYENHGFIRIDREARTNSGGSRVESLWLSPRTWEAKQEERKRAHMEREAAALPLFAHSGVTS